VIILTRKERIIKALKHEEPDRIPIDLRHISIRAYNNLLAYLGINNDDIEVTSTYGQKAAFDRKVFKEMGLEICPDTEEIRLSGPCNWRPCWKLDIQTEKDCYWFIDEWQRKWRMPKDGYYYDIVEFPLSKIDNINDYNWPDPEDPARFAGIENLVKHYRENTDAALFFQDTIGNGFLQMGAMLYGYENWFLMLASEPQKAHKFLDKYLELKLKFWDEILTRIGNEIDVVLELDDLGAQDAPLISTQMYKKFIKPRQKRLFSFIKERTKAKLFFHSDGAIYDFIPDLIEVGVDILNPIQYSAAKMDTKILKKEFGKDLVFWGGGIDTQNILPFGSKDQITEEIKSKINDLAPGGGFVFDTTHVIQSDVPPENIVTMLETFNNYCKY
jgi:uroporphyrinogen decarboxylase